MTSSTPSHVEAASTLAVIASSNEPLLFLTADLKLIAASASFCRAFDGTRERFFPLRDPELEYAD